MHAQIGTVDQPLARAAWARIGSELINGTAAARASSSGGGSSTDSVDDAPAAVRWPRLVPDVAPVDASETGRDTAPAR
jgi:hypothetical protein